MSATTYRFEVTIDLRESRRVPFHIEISAANMTAAEEMLAVLVAHPIIELRILDSWSAHDVSMN